jgi:hypothetical protein
MTMLVRPVVHDLHWRPQFARQRPDRRLTPAARSWLGLASEQTHPDLYAMVPKGSFETDGRTTLIANSMIVLFGGEHD